MFEADILAVHETAPECKQLFLLVAHVGQVPHHAVPRLARTAPHQQHHADREGLEVGVVVLLADEACLAEEVDAQRGEDELAQHHQQGDVGQRGQDEDQGVDQQLERACFLHQPDHTHHTEGSDHRCGRPDVNGHLLREDRHGQDDTDVSADYHDEVEHVPRVAELLAAQCNLLYDLLQVEYHCED